MTKELYIFSNNPVPPVRLLREGIESDYVDLSTYLDPSVAAAPSYTGTPETNKGIAEIDRFKRDLVNPYKFVHVYVLLHSEVEKDAEVSFYSYSHKEFNVEDERNRA